MSSDRRPDTSRRGRPHFTTESPRTRGKAGDLSIDDITSRIIGAAICVHREMGPGLLESIYERCMVHELCGQGLAVERQVPLAGYYKGLRLDCCYRLDLLVEKKVLIELKAIERIEPIHSAQLLTYLKLTGLYVGLLINFNVPLLKDGIRRLVYGQPPPPRPL